MKIIKRFGLILSTLIIGVGGSIIAIPVNADIKNKENKYEIKQNSDNIQYAPSLLGLDPENDPVIYTTESGLEIKYGGVDLNNSLASGKPLSGYPYFTMGTYGGYSVNWVIIGRNADVTSLNTAIKSYLFSIWKANEASIFGQYFFNNQYEILTPAGTSINQDAQTKAYVSDNETISLTQKGIVSNAEIPSGCVLAISECSMGRAVFDNTSPANYEGSPLQSAVLALYNSGLGLSTAQQNMIIAQNLTNCYGTSTNGYRYDLTYNSSSTSQKLFPLASTKDLTSYPAITNQNFKIETYLTSTSLRICNVIGTTTKTRYWTRSNLGFSGDADAILLNGATDSGDKTIVNGEPTSTGGTSFDLNAAHSLGVRPAGVFKLG